MNKITVCFGEKEERNNVYINFEGREKELLTFDSLKKIVKELLEFKIKGEDYSYDVSPEENDQGSKDALSIYIDTIKDAFDSVLNDEELCLVLKEDQVEKPERSIS